MQILSSMKIIMGEDGTNKGWSNSHTTRNSSEPTFCFSFLLFFLLKSFSSPEAELLFGQHQESRLGRAKVRSTRREFVSYSQPIIRFDSELAQRDRKSVNGGLPVLDQSRGARPMGARMSLT